MNASSHESHCLCQKYQLSDGGKKARYPKGTVIFMEGAPVFGLYCLCKGKAKLSRTEEDGKEVILRLLGSGEVMGNRCFFSRSTFGMTSTALEDCEVSFLERSQVLNLISLNPDASHVFLKDLGKELEDTDRRMSALMRKKVGERMAEFFLNMQESFGKREDNELKLDIHLSREEMASIVGTSSETVTRYITEFKNKSIIMEKDRFIYILDQNKLRTVCHFPLDSTEAL